MRHNRSVVAIFCFVLVSCWLPPANSVAQPPTPQPTPVEIRIDPAAFDPFVGQYEDAENLGGTIFSFFREGDKYYLQVINQDRLELAPSAASTFFVKENPRLTAEFVRDAAGRVTGMTWRQGAQEFRTRKIADKPLPDARVTYKRTEAMIPMRDGVKLFTVILTPEVQTEPLPILLNRTPYGVEQRLHLQKGPPHHGPDPIHLVPPLRPQPPKIRRKHLPRQRSRFPISDPADLQIRKIPNAHKRFSSSINESGFV